MNRGTNRAERGAETNAAFLQHTPELTGFYYNDQEKRDRERESERRWRSGSSDKALVSLPIERPSSHISLCEGETERSGSTTWLLLLAKRYSKEKR